MKPVDLLKVPVIFLEKSMQSMFWMWETDCSVAIYPEILGVSQWLLQPGCVMS